MTPPTPILQKFDVVLPPDPQIALPLGFSSCYKSIVASRKSRNNQNDQTTWQPNATTLLARANTQGKNSNVIGSIGTATKNPPTGAAVVPVEGNVP